MALEQINNGDTGAQAAAKIFNNDKKIAFLTWSSSDVGAEYPTVRKKDGVIYAVIEGKIANNLAPDLAPDIWEKLGGGNPVDIVNEAFEGTTAINLTIGRDLNTFGTSTPTATFPNPLFNNTFCPGAGVIKKIRVRVLNSGNMNLCLVAVNPESKTLLVKYTFTVTLIAGVNEIDVNIACAKNDVIGTFGGPCSIRFIDESADTGKYYSNAQNPFLWNKGALCINFDFEGVADAGYTVDRIKLILDSIGTSTGESSEHARIDIEGQSNALGVGALSGLKGNTPYNAVPFNWGYKFSRVFIFNPRTNNYENLQIGVNNMASWDGDYVYPSSSPTPYPTFGPEVGIALIWQNSTKRGNLYIDKNIGDGRPIAYFQKGTAYYTTLLNRKTAANKWLRDRGIFAPPIGFVWVQGEADGGGTSAYYLGALQQLVNDRKTDLVFSDTTRKVIAQIGATSSGYSAAVASAKNQYVASDLLSVAIPYPPYYNGDNVHINHRGQIELGLNSAIFILFSDNIIFEQLEPKIFWMS